MTSECNDTNILLHRAIRGDEQALTQLFARYKHQLWQMVRIRLDRRVQSRVDPSDVLQEAYLDVSRRIADYDENSTYPFFLWLRQIVGQRLIDIHRMHLGAKMRDAGREVSLCGAALPQATSASLAAQLLGQWTSASRAVERAEMQLAVQEALNTMDLLDREILALRHFEMLSNSESAQVLNISTGAASKRYIRALVRIKDVLKDFPGFDDEFGS